MYKSYKVSEVYSLAGSTVVLFCQVHIPSITKGYKTS